MKQEAVKKWRSPEWLNVTLILAGAVASVYLLIWAAKNPPPPPREPPKPVEAVRTAPTVASVVESSKFQAEAPAVVAAEPVAAAPPKAPPATITEPKAAIPYDVGILPAEMALKVKEYSGFGTYVTDKPRAPVVSSNRVVETNGPSLDRMNLFPTERSLPRLLGALQRELPDRLARLGVSFDWKGAMNMAAEVDSATAVRLAEAQLRMAEEWNLPRMVMQLAAAYRAAGQVEKLRALVGEGEVAGVFVVPAANSFLPELDGALPAKAETDDLGNLWHNHQLAILKGDVAQAKSTFDQLNAKLNAMGPTAAEAVNLKRLVTHTKQRVDRLEAGIDRKKVSGVASAFRWAKRLAVSGHEPLSNRLAKASVMDVVTMIRQASMPYGAQSDEVADLVVYLVEQRGYNGTDVPPDLLYGAAMKVQSRDPVRALPLFALTQRTAVLTASGVKATNDQYAVDAALGMVRSLRNVRRLMRLGLFEPMRAIVDKAIEISVTAPEGTVASLRHAWLIQESWELNRRFDRADLTIADAQERMKSSPSATVRHEARMRVARHLLSQGENDKAQEILREVAGGVDRPSLAWEGIQQLQAIAAKDQDEKLWNEANEYARKMLAKVDAGSTSADRLREIMARPFKKKTDVAVP